jgi:hypothetical protein
MWPGAQVYVLLLDAEWHSLAPGAPLLTLSSACTNKQKRRRSWLWACMYRHQHRTCPEWIATSSRKLTVCDACDSFTVQLVIHSLFGMTTSMQVVHTSAHAVVTVTNQHGRRVAASSGSRQFRPACTDQHLSQSPGHAEFSRSTSASKCLLEPASTWCRQWTQQQHVEW